MSNFAVEAIVMGLLLIFAAVFIVVARIARNRFYRLNRVVASISEVQPAHTTAGWEKTDEVKIRFHFSVDKKHYSGQATLPLSHFLGDQHEPEPIIFREPSIDLPILKYNGEVYAGIEAIEFLLLQKRDLITINYRSRIPGESFSVENTNPRIQRIKDNQL